MRQEKFDPEVQKSFRDFANNPCARDRSFQEVIDINAQKGLLIIKNGYVYTRAFYRSIMTAQGSTFLPTGQLGIGEIGNSPKFVNSVHKHIEETGQFNPAALGTRFNYNWPPGKDIDGSTDFRVTDVDSALFLQSDFEGHLENLWYTDHLLNETLKIKELFENERLSRAQSIQNGFGFKLAVNDNYFTFFFLRQTAFIRKIVIPRSISPRAIFGRMVNPELLENPLQTNTNLDTWRNADLSAENGIKVIPVNIPYNDMYSNPSGVNFSRFGEEIEAESQFWEEHQEK